MSIYATWLSLDLESDHDPERCASYVEDPEIPRCFDLTGEPCSCEGYRWAPFIYQGSHVLPSQDDPHGGHVGIAGVPVFITRDGRDDGHEGPKDWLRLSVSTDASTYGVEGEQHADVVLDRRQVERIRDCLTEWLERDADV